MSTGVDYKLFIDTVQAASRTAAAQTPEQPADQGTTVTNDEVFEAIKLRPLTFLEVMSLEVMSLEVMRRFGLDFDKARPMIDAPQKAGKITLKTSEEDGRERFEVVT